MTENSASNNNESIFLYENNSLKDELDIVINNSKPTPAVVITFTKTNFDFNTGVFIIYIKCQSMEIPLVFNNTWESINNLWRFLEVVIHTTKPVIMHLFYKGVQTFMYIEPKDEERVRFIITDTEELHKKERARKILRYSCAESRVDLDIIIKKKILIRQFYDLLFNEFGNFAPIAYFEPPFIDFNSWIQDSDVIRKYLKLKKNVIIRGK